MRKQALLTKKTESKISETLSEIMDLTACGLSPHEAMIKAAREADLSIDQVRLLAHAYNTGSVLNQINSGQTVFEKAASPELVDPELVIRSIFKDISNTRKSATAADYFLPPRSLFKKPLPPAICKAASSINTQQRESPADVRERKKLAEQAVSAVKYAGLYNYAAAVDRLREYFNTPNAIDPSEVLENSSACLGRQAEDLIRQAVAGVVNRRFIKNAAVDWQRPPYSYVRNGVDAVTKKELAENVESKLAGDKKIANLAKLREPVYGSVVDHIVNSSCLNIKFAQFRDAPSMQGLKELGAPNKESDVLKDFATDAPGRQALTEAKVKAYLAELASNDSIISEYDDKEIANAFNELSRLAPNAMQNPIILKQYLRKYLASGGMLESFDLDQLMQLNQKSVSNIKSTISELV